MEFSFGFVITTLAGWGLYTAGKHLLGVVKKSHIAQWIAGILSAGLLFFFPAAGAVVVIFLSMPLWIEKLALFRRFDGLVYQVPFLVIMLMFSVFYIPETSRIWYAADNAITGILSSFSLLDGYGFIDVYYVLRFFRNIYPALFAFILFLAYYAGTEGGKYRHGLWYRYLRKFDHRQVWPVLGLLAMLGGGYILMFSLNEINPVMNDIGIWMFNTSLFFAMPYILYGCLTLIYGLRRAGVPGMISLMGLFLLFLISGPVFIFTLIFLMGIGISDIWMNYHARLSHKKKENERRLP
ncbi:MAG: hypothetical protein HPY53_08765 [Brevinematales bacterium]|nr:hypothetical protein [Brevinematales bacterium]